MSESIKFVGKSGRRYTYSPMPLAHPGRFGAVFPGTADDGESVAVKRITISHESLSRWYGDRSLAERELEVAFQLNRLPHEYLVPIVDSADVEEDLLLVMPKAECSLAERLRSGMDDNAVIEVVRHVARGLEELTTAGVVHRDIKPGNVLYLTGKWRLSDFGISKILDNASGTHTWMGTGTLEYRAPELWNGSPETRQSDFYALGCLAYEARVGRVPFSGHDIKFQHQTSVPVVPADVVPVLTRVIMLLLAKQPGERPGDPREILELLGPRKTDSPYSARIMEIVAESAKYQMEKGAAAGRASHLRELAQQAAWRFGSIWNQLTEELERLGAAPQSSCEKNIWLLTIGIHRVWVPIGRDPLRVDDVVIYGHVNIGRTELMGGATVANLVCIEDGDFIKWQLVQFQANAAARSRNRIGHPRMMAGLEGEKFSSAWSHRREPVPPAVTRVTDLNKDALLALLMESIKPTA